MSNFDYDLFVIGGGSGGVRAGRVAAGMGKRVGIAEEYRYGGTCVIRGCVPKKLMVYASHYSHDFNEAKEFGWDITTGPFDWKSFIAKKDTEIDRLEGLYKKGLNSAGAEIFNTRAVIDGPNSVRLLADETTVTAERILIAVGGTPNKLDGLEGAEHCITSDEIFHLEELPHSMVIYGGGYIAVEFACIMAGLGTKVSLIYRGEKILRGFDMDLRNDLQEIMVARGIDLRCETQISAIEKNNDGSFKVKLDSDAELTASQVMLATGRKPLTQDLGLATAGVEMDRHGNILVDEYSRTNVSNILAVGDVTNRVPLTPVAIHESMCLIQTEYNDNPVSPDHDLIATAVFSQPEIGTIGKSQEEAAEEFDSVDIYSARFRPMKATISGSQEKMLMKLLVETSSQKVIGLHIMGDGAGEMIQAFAVAIKMGATKQDFDRTMAVHPTAGEELVTLSNPSYQVGKSIKA